MRGKAGARDVMDVPGVHVHACMRKDVGAHGHTGAGARVTSGRVGGDEKASA
ncbi:hypothetical protein CRG98_049396 [Punica granatum]|uniref:Uncharacterized protein n=1 Tax=Punica granatum TaxID=22663 RepID=A0A2I0HF01_PUNGR|nr:hypothetical protein CRG98_049396 [Punica granatum]